MLAVAAVGGYMYLTRPVEPSTALPANPAAGSSHMVLSVVAEESEVRYEIDEVLRGEPTHVVGVSNQIAGSVVLPFTPEESFVINDIAINARTFKTDNASRDGAVARLILKSEDAANEFITLKNIRVGGFTGPLQNDKSFEFSAMGDLTISGVTKEQAFVVSGVYGSDGALRVTARATVLRSQFGLVIPTLSFLADVKDEVVLTAELVLR